MKLHSYMQVNNLTILDNINQYRKQRKLVFKSILINHVNLKANQKLVI